MIERDSDLVLKKAKSIQLIEIAPGHRLSQLRETKTSLWVYTQALNLPSNWKQLASTSAPIGEPKLAISADPMNAPVCGCMTPVMSEWKVGVPGNANWIKLEELDLG